MSFPVVNSNRAIAVNFDAVANHQDPGAVADALESLQSANILTQENRDTVAKHQDPGAVADALEHLQRAHILTQENFNNLFKRRRI